MIQMNRRNRNLKSAHHKLILQYIPNLPSQLQIRIRNEQIALFLPDTLKQEEFGGEVALLDQASEVCIVILVVGEDRIADLDEVEESFVGFDHFEGVGKFVRNKVVV